MICLPDALRRFKNPNAEPCPPCVIAALRNPLGEALAIIKGELDAEFEAAPDPALKGLPILTHAARANPTAAARHRQSKRYRERLRRREAAKRLNAPAVGFRAPNTKPVGAYRRSALSPTPSTGKEK